MPFMLAMVMLFVGMVYALCNYIKKGVFWKICWESNAFEYEYISQVKIELPMGSYLPFYLKRECNESVRDTKYQWVPTRDLVPTGTILVGNKDMMWYDVLWNDSEQVVPSIILGYVPVEIAKMARIIPWKLIQGAYQ